MPAYRVALRGPGLGVEITVEAPAARVPPAAWLPLLRAGRPQRGRQEPTGFLRQGLRRLPRSPDYEIAPAYALHSLRAGPAEERTRARSWKGG